MGKHTLVAAALASSLFAAITAAHAAPPPPTGAVGRYNNGALVDGRAMPEEGAAFYLLFPARCYASPAFADIYRDPDRTENTWGHPVVIDALTAAADTVRRQFPDAPRLVIGEIANRRGGKIPWHLSHQSGLDADLVFLQRGDGRWPIAPCTPYGALRRFEAIDPKTSRWGVTDDFERAWNWRLAAELAQRKDVQAIFVGALIEKELSDWSRREKVPAAERQVTLAKLMPVTCAAPKGVKLPFYKNNYCPHDDHFHVRFKCPADSAACVGPRAPRIP